MVLIFYIFLGYFFFLLKFEICIYIEIKYDVYEFRVYLGYCYLRLEYNNFIFYRYDYC